jgi:hypothetical protein
MMWIALVMATLGAVLAAIGGGWVIAAASAATAAFAATHLYRDESTRDRGPRRPR